MHCLKRSLALSAMFGGLVGAAGLVQPAHADQTYNSGSIVLKRAGHNQWGAPGEYGILDWKKTHPFAFSQRFGPVVDVGIDPVSDTVGGGLEFNVNGEVGVGITVTGKNGEVNVTYPMNVVLTYPDPRTLRPGDTFTIHSSFARSGNGTLSTSAPDFGFKLRGILSGTLGIDAAIWYPGPLDSRVTLLEPTGVDLSTTIFDTDFPGFKEVVGATGDFSLFDGVVEGTYKFPSVKATGGNGPGSSLVASGSDEFIHVEASITEAILLAVTGAPIDLQGSDSIFDGALSYEYSLLDLYLGGGFSLLQNFEFNPKPLVSLQLSNGETKTFYVGDSITLTMPAPAPGAVANDLTLAPTFTTEGTVRNKSDLRATVGLYFEPLTLGLGVHVGPVDFDETWSPFGTITIFEEQFDVSLIDKTFTMKGFNAVNGTPFTVEGYRYATPTLSQVTPQLVKLNSGAFSLGVTGTNFVDAYTNGSGTSAGSKVRWDGSERPTTFGSDTQLTAAISAADAAVEGVHQVTVQNPAPGGGASNNVPVIVDGTPPVIAGTATPSVLDKTGNPNLLISVTVAGKITDALSGVDPSTARFAVSDEYHQIEPTGAVTVNGDGTYSFVVRLSPTRQAKDTNGRLYTITLQAKDKLGFTATKTVTVTAQ